MARFYPKSPAQSPPWEFPWWGGYSFLGTVQPKGPKSSMRNSSSVGSILGKILPEVPKFQFLGEGIRGKVLPEVPKSSFRSSISGRGYSAKNTLFCVILTTLLSHWARLCITDNLSWVETYYQLELSASRKPVVLSLLQYQFPNAWCAILLAVTFLLRHCIERQCRPNQHTINAFLDKQPTQIFTRIH